MHLLNFQEKTVVVALELDIHKLLHIDKLQNEILPLASDWEIIWRIWGLSCSFLKTLITDKMSIGSSLDARKKHKHFYNLAMCAKTNPYANFPLLNSEELKWWFLGGKVKWGTD